MSPLEKQLFRDLLRSSSSEKVRNPLKESYGYSLFINKTFLARCPCRV